MGVKDFIPYFTPHTRPLRLQGQINLSLWAQNHPYITHI